MAENQYSQPPAEPKPEKLSAPQAATVAELKAAMPDSDPAFREQCLEKGLTLAQAKDAWMERMREQLQARDQQIGELKNKKPAPGVEPLGENGQGSTETSADFMTAAKALAEEEKISVRTAQSRIAAAHPELYEAYKDTLRTDPPKNRRQ